MPDARCPMPDARCPMPDAQFPIPKYYECNSRDRPFGWKMRQTLPGRLREVPNF